MTESIHADIITVPLLIDGESVSTTTHFDVISPHTAKTIWRCSSVSREDAIAAVDAASKAFPAWSATKPAVRRGIFLKAADILEQRAIEFQEYMSQETGTVGPFLAFNVRTACELLRDVAGRISGALVGSTPVCEENGMRAMVAREPYGVVLGIAPWNAPYILGFRAVIYALAAGNTCILKGSEVSPRCFWAIGSILHEAGLPNGCLNVLFHSPEAAAEITTALIEHPAVRKINFTGSTAVGRIIAASAGRNLKPVLLELGGKSSAIVCEDADLELAARECAVGAFLNAGQICMSTERILVHRAVVEPFVTLLRSRITEIFEEASPVQTLSQGAAVDRNRRLLADALTKGASIPHGDHGNPISKFEMKPTVVQGVTSEMDIYHTESFGASVSVITVDTDDEAIAISNDTDYGLSGAVFTRDLSKGLNIADRMKTGAVHINSKTVHDEAGLAHGGVKNSGWGRFNAAAGLDEFLQTKVTTFRC